MDAIKNAWENHFFQVPNAIYDNKELNAYELSLLQYLFRLSNNGEAFPSLKNIAETLQCSVPTVNKTIKSLTKKSYIVKKARKNKNGGQTSNLYILLDPCKRDLVGGVNEIATPTKGGLQPPINEVSTINTKSINTNLQSNVSKSTLDYSNEFEQFWHIYPRKKEKKAASKSFTKARKKNTLEAIIIGTQRYADECELNQTELKFIKHPTTFLNKESFIDILAEMPLPDLRASVDVTSSTNVALKGQVNGKLNAIDHFFKQSNQASVNGHDPQ